MDFGSLLMSEVDRLDAACDAYEAAWRAGRRPRIEDFLDGAGGAGRDRWFRALLALELEFRRGAGERPGPQEYLHRFPGHADDIEAAFAGAATDYAGATGPGSGPDSGGRAPAPRWNCPQCHEPLEVPDDASSDAVGCASCGITIRLDPPPVEARPLGGSRLGKYEILEEIGRGAFGVVYHARDTELDRAVALKVLRAGRFAPPEEVGRFLREARSAAQLEHPHIVAVHDAGRIDEASYLVCEYVPGTTLAARMAAGRLSFREAAALVKQVAEALGYAHRRGVIHRDIKPSNILLDREGRAHLTDFGLARREAGDVTLTCDGVVLGTPAYMSPEQARGEGRAVDGRSDVYSLGVVLYQLLSGELPFRGNMRMHLHQVLNEEPEPPRRLNDRIPRDLETICLKAMAKEPERRYPTAAALAEELQRFLAGQPIHARPVGRGERLWRWARRNPALATAVGAAAVALGVAVALMAAFALHRARAARQAQRLSAELIVGRALGDFERGEVGRGMLWLARGLQFATAAQDDRLQRSIRANLGCWRRQIHPLKHLLLNPGAVQIAAFSRDGRTVLTGDEGGSVRLWDAATGRPLGRPIDHGAALTAAALSADSSVVLTGGADRAVRLWDAATGRPIGQPLNHGTRKVLSLDLSPDGRIALTGGADGLVRLWDVATGRPRGAPLWYDRRSIIGATIARLSPDGRTALTGCIDRKVRLWDVATGRPIGQPLDHGSPLAIALFSPDGTTVLTGGWDPDGKALLWDVATGRPIGQPLRHRYGVTAAAFSPDGATVLTGGANRVARLWDVATGRPIAGPLEHQGHVVAAAFSPDGSIALTGSEDGTARLWDVATGRPIGQPLLHQGGVTVAAFSPDGSGVLTAGKEPAARLWEVAPDRRPRRALGHDKGIVSIAYSPDGRAVLTGGKDGTARLWDATSGRPIGRPLEHRGEVNCVGFSRDGRVVLTGSQDGTARLWDAATGRPIGRPLGHPDAVKGVALSPDGATVLTGSLDGTARLWDAASGEPRGRPIKHGDKIWCVALSPDGRIALTGGADRTARLWDATTGRPLGQPLRHGGGVTAIAFPRDGTAVLTGSLDGTARLWDATTGRPLGAPLMHEAGVYAVALSPDGRTALTGGEDNMARFWDTATCQPLGPALVHRGFVAAVSFNPDGRTAVTGSEDGATRFWEVPVPLAGEGDRILRWVQVLTGVQWDRMEDSTQEGSWDMEAGFGETAGVIRGLDPPAWQRLRQELQERGGPPIP